MRLSEISTLAPEVAVLNVPIVPVIADRELTFILSDVIEFEAILSDVTASACILSAVTAPTPILSDVIALEAMFVADMVSDAILFSFIVKMNCHLLFQVR